MRMVYICGKISMVMKRIVLFLIPTLFLLYSCKSREDKALELIDQQMFQTLYDYDSYQPVETKVDSAFTSPYYSDSILALVMIYDEYQKRADDYKDKADDAQSTMEIWEDSYSSYARTRYREARTKWIDNTISSITEHKKALTAILMASEAIRDFKPEYYGWAVYHKYRCKSKGGNALLCEAIYIVDNDIKSIIKTIDIDDDDYKKAKKHIDEIIEDMSDEYIKGFEDLIEQLETLIDLYESLK